jgi:hypothetical protein
MDQREALGEKRRQKEEKMNGFDKLKDYIVSATTVSLAQQDIMQQKKHRKRH